MDSTNIQPSWPHAWSVRHIYWVTTCDPLVTDILVSDIYLKCSPPTPDRGPPPPSLPCHIVTLNFSIRLASINIQFRDLLRLFLLRRYAFKPYSSTPLWYIFTNRLQANRTLLILQRGFFSWIAQWIYRKICWSMLRVNSSIKKSVDQ